MELQQLRHFLAVAEERHFTRAARRSHIVQSGLSASIQALENELNAPLFIRSTRRVELTEAGRALMIEARRVLSAVQAASDAVKAVEGLLQGTLNVGIMQRFALTLDLPAILGEFHAEYPGVQMHLVQAGSTILMEGLRENRFDIAILAQVGEPPDTIATTTVERDALVLALPRNHALARRKELALAALAGETFVEFQPDWGARQLVDLAFSTVRVQRKIACEVNDIPTLLDLVANGLGIALIPSAFTQYRADISIVKPRAPVPIWNVVVAHAGTQPANPAARALAKALCKNQDRHRRSSGGAKR